MRTEGPGSPGAAGWVPRRPATPGPSPSSCSLLREALLEDPLGEPVLSRHRLRPAVTAALELPPGPLLLAAVEELMTVALSGTREGSEDGGDGDDGGEELPAGAGGVELSGREWLEITCALDRCASATSAATLAAVAALDRARLAENPSRAAARDTRRLAADDLAPALRTPPGAASALVGLARQVESDLPLAAQALADGHMTLAQLKVLAAAVKHLPPAAARAVEEVAVRKAATTVRAQLAAAVEEAAVQADPGYAARRTAAGVQERDVALRRSPVPGCVRLVADLERLDGTAAWQVINAMAVLAKEADPPEDDPGWAEERTLAQLRADGLVSILVGDLAPTATAAATDDGDDGAGGGEDAGDEPAAPVDTRAPVRIPTPEHRARLAEVHVVVLDEDVEDLIDDLLNDPDEGPDDGDGPGGGSRGAAPPPPEDVGRVDLAADRVTRSGTGLGREPDAEPEEVTTGRGGQQRGRRRRPRARRRALAGQGPFGYVPGTGRLAPTTTRTVLARAPWRRLSAEATTATLRTRSRWLLPPPHAVPGPAADPATDPAKDPAIDLARVGAELRERLDRLRALPTEAPPGPTTAYRPTSVIAAHVRARDATCLGPACHHAARSGGIQLDHTRAWGPATPTRTRGGTTGTGNLGCLCQRVHTAKTHGGWDLTQPSPGSFVWTSPLGRTFHRRAAPLLPDLAAVDGA